MKASSAGFALAALPIAPTAYAVSNDGLEVGFLSLDNAGQTIPTYFAVKKGVSKAPIVLLVHEIWGLHEHMQDVCRRLANEGYFAVAPYLYSRQGDVTKLPTNDEIFALVGKVSDKDVLADLDIALAWAKQQPSADPSRCGVLGFCWGGTYVWLYSEHNATVKAGAAFYGPLKKPKSALHPKDPIDIVPTLKTPVLGIYAGKDTHISGDDVNALDQALSKQTGGSRVSVYPEAEHGFYADYRPSYNERAATEAWAEMLLWFEQNGLGNTSFPASAITEAEVLASFDRFVTALKAGDLNALEDIYSDDYLLVRPDGTTLRKKQILDDLRAHTMIFTDFKTDHVVVKTAGPVGTLATETRNTYQRDGKEGHMHAQQVVIFLKSSQGIVVTHFQSTNIAG